MNRHLPVLPNGIEKIGYKVLRALDRMNFVHKNGDGSYFTIRFSDAVLFGSDLLMLTVDTERLWHFSIADLAKKKVVEDLMWATGYPVKVTKGNGGGLAYLVLLKEIVDSQPKLELPQCIEFDLTLNSEPLHVPVGYGENGYRWVHISRLQHVMVVGATGSGKSSWIHLALLNLANKSTPEQVNFYLIDPKRSELTLWRDAPHTVRNVATDTDTARSLLAEVTNEIEHRGDLFDKARVRNINTYNKSSWRLPYIVVVIDECLDLALDGDRDVLRMLKQISIKGRAVGVYLWVATQHGTAAASLPRVMNVNLLSRLVFRVADAQAARSGGCPGAEEIQRNCPGRFLAKLDGAPQLYQAFYMDDERLDSLVSQLSTSKRKQVVITDSERELVEYAILELDGAFSVNKLASARINGWTNNKINKLAIRWEGLGLLEYQGQGRFVTDELKNAVEWYAE